LPESRHRRRRGRGSTRAGTSIASARPRPRKNSWVYIIASSLIAVLVIAGFAVGAVGIREQGGDNSETSNTYVPGIGVQHDIMPTRSHVSEPQTVQYDTFPPTSGDHWPQWSNCGFYEEELSDERIVHNLEHSNIVVSYNLSTPEEIDQLRGIINDIGLANVTGVTHAYSKIPVGTVAMSAWGVSDSMEGIDQSRIETFFKTYSGQLGPEGDITCLNNGVMP
jgi:hypothetical protein